MKISKEMINFLRNEIKRTIKESEEFLRSLKEQKKLLDEASYTAGEYYQDPTIPFQNKASKLLENGYDRLDARMEVEKHYFKALSSIDVNMLSELKKVSETISTEGLVYPSVANRILYYTDFDKPEFQKVILNGIRLNGLSDLTSKDEIERKEYELEKLMAPLIDSELQVTEIDLFMSYFAKIVNSGRTNIDSSMKKAKAKIILNMESYLRVASAERIFNETLTMMRETLKKEKAKEKETKEEKIKPSPLQEYIRDGKVIKICDLKLFKELLKSSSNYTEVQKEEFLRQMINFINKEKDKANELKIKLLFDRLLTEEQKNLYSLAKVSGDVVKTQIISEIDTILQLLIECKEDEREELIDELNANFAYLKDLDKEEAEEEYNKLIYYKILDEKTGLNLPNLYLELEREGRDIYKNIFNVLSRLNENITTGDKKVLGVKSEYPIWAKGKDYKIFYTIVNGYIVVITGGRKDTGYSTISRIISSVGFKELCESLKNEENINLEEESKFTSSIIEELEKASAVRKLTQKGNE